MRKIALCTALIAALASGTASAKNDFDALLGELDFGGSNTTATSALTLNKIAADNLAPAPHSQVSAQAPITDPGPTPEPESIVMPVPEPDASAHPAMPEQAMPIEQDYTAELGAPIAGPSCGCAAPQQSRCNPCCDNRRSCNSCSLNDCNLLNKLSSSCVPYTPPNLPTSSFYQYFKSNSCNCRVWDGYQNKCVLCSKHSRGECDCFDPSKKSCLSGSCGNGCSSGCCEPAGTCDQGCHQLPACWSGNDCAGEATCGAPACDSPCCDG